MAAPTFVTKYETVYSDATTPKTASVTVGAGDTLVILGYVESDGDTLSTPTGGGLTYTLQQAVGVSQYTRVYVWTAPSVSGQTFTLSIAKVGATGLFFGFCAYRFSGSSGIGASNKTNVASGATTLNLLTTAANSAIVVGSGDWVPQDGASRTWRTGAGALTEQTYFRDASHYALYGGYHADAGAINTYAVGQSAPAAQKYSVVAVEVLGSAAAAASAPPPSAWSRRRHLLVR